MVNIGCPDCNRNFIENEDMCPEHKVEYLKWLADTAQDDYEEAKAEYEEAKAEFERKEDEQKNCHTQT